MLSVAKRSTFTYGGKVAGAAVCMDCDRPIALHAPTTLACPATVPTCDEPDCPVCDDLRRHA